MYFNYDENGEIVGLSCEGKEYFYIRDITGNITKIVDEDGRYVVSYTYDAWGNFKKIVHRDCLVAYHNPFVYKGYFFDSETGWFYLKSRYYDPTIRRFINADGFSYLDNDSLTGLNFYSYCYNCPISYVDLEGNLPITICQVYLVAQRGNQGNQKLTKYSYYTDEQILEMYYNLCKKGRLTKKEKEELKDLEKELKARGLKNKRKRKENHHSNFSLENLAIIDSLYLQIALSNVVVNITTTSSVIPNTESSFDWETAGKIAGGALVLAGIATVIYTIANDVTVVGIADDVPTLVAAWELIKNGWKILF